MSVDAGKQIRVKTDTSLPQSNYKLKCYIAGPHEVYIPMTPISVYSGALCANCDDTTAYITRDTNIFPS